MPPEHHLNIGVVMIGGVEEGQANERRWKAAGKLMQPIANLLLHHDICLATGGGRYVYDN